MDMDILECLIAMTLRSIKKLIAQLMNGNIFAVIALRKKYIRRFAESRTKNELNFIIKTQFYSY